MKHTLIIILALAISLFAEAQTFPKAILKGDYPDPSIVRDGKDFYMTHSPFFYAPGFLIWHSTDLVNWEPMLDENGEFLKVMTPRAGKFDSDLTECGPPAILTDKGILLFYNGKNKSGAEGDTLYTANSYCAGQALFDAKDPTKLIDRLDKPFYIPESDFEKSGQYPAGTVFIEGLVFHNQKWFLYYGCADSRVAVAVYDPLKK